jgi:putative flippase GtrA
VAGPVSRLLPVADSPRIATQWLRYTVVGASNTALYAATYMLLAGAGVHYIFASSLAFALGVLNSYALNRRWTFRSDGRRAPELARFLSTQLVGVAASVSLLAALVAVGGLNPLVAQAVAFPVSSLITFALSREWAFAASSSSHPR